MVFPKKNFIFVEINHFTGQLLLLKIKENGPVDSFSQDFWFLCFTSPPKRTIFSQCRREAVLGTFSPCNLIRLSRNSAQQPRTGVTEEKLVMWASAGHLKARD